MIPSYFSEDFTPRALLLERLEVARAHVVTGERTQAMYLEHRNRLERELATTDSE